METSFTGKDSEVKTFSFFSFTVVFCLGSFFYLQNLPVLKE